MKRNIKTLGVALLFFWGASAPSYGQNMYASAAAKTFNTSILTALGAVDKEPVAAVDPLINSSFSALFPNATEPKWSRKVTHSFVSFLNNGHKATASFSPKGALNYVITECDPEQLPKLFNKKIKKSYATYRLLQATEIQAYGQKTYQVVLEDAFRFVTLKYTADGIETTQIVHK
ncbi:MAG: hypothetical protein J7539_12060 [Niabella sp.]|nr:hypothetical protein [Niabella sp.]